MTSILPAPNIPDWVWDALCDAEELLEKVISDDSEDTEEDSRSGTLVPE